jgi:hypothetical protein
MSNIKNYVFSLVKVVIPVVVKLYMYNVRCTIVHSTAAGSKAVNMNEA